MINKILEFSMRQPGFILLAAVMLLGVGLWSALHLPIDAVPDITAPQVQVNTEVPALAAEESEKLITHPIEIALAGLPGVEEMRSLTKFGLSQVTIQFKDNTDITGRASLSPSAFKVCWNVCLRERCPNLRRSARALGKSSTTASTTVPVQKINRQRNWSS